LTTYRDIVSNGYDLEIKDGEADTLSLDVINPFYVVVKTKIILPKIIKNI
jgi:hypothetical protein